MGVNKKKDHLLILVEDRPYEQMANGFVEHDEVLDGVISIGRVARGIEKLKKQFNNDIVTYLERNPLGQAVFLFDGDKQVRHIEIINDAIAALKPEGRAERIKTRVYTLSCLKQSEDLKKELGYSRPEMVGRELAERCRHMEECLAPGSPWLCHQLAHNRLELQNLLERVHPFIFKSGQPALRPAGPAAAA